MSRKAKILIVGASPILPTGMAEVIRLIFGALLDRYPDRYELHQVGLFHSQFVTPARWPAYATRSMKNQDGVQLFRADDADGQITFREVVAQVRPDIVFAFNDTHRVLHLCDEAAQRPYKLILYVNFDGFPFPPDQGPILNRADVIFTMSEFAKRVALACLPAIEPAKLHHMYSPADTARFSPVLRAEKAARRLELMPDWMPRNAFLLGWVGRCQWRKQVWIPYRLIHHLRSGDYLTCQACSRVSIIRNYSATIPEDQERDFGLSVAEGRDPTTCAHCRSPCVKLAGPLPDVVLWLHMPHEPQRQDWDPAWLETQANVTHGKDIHYTDSSERPEFERPEDMPAIYQILDCLLYLSGGEGFGLPAWEAMCSAVPVVYTNYSSHAEFLGKANAGLPTGGVLQPGTGTCVWRMIADMPQAIEAVRKLYFHRDLAETLGANGRRFVQDYTPEIQAERWHRCFQELLPKCAS